MAQDCKLSIQIVSYITEDAHVVGDKCKHCEDMLVGKCKSLSLMMKINDKLSVDTLGYFCNSCGQMVEEIVNEFNNH